MNVHVYENIICLYTNIYIYIYIFHTCMPIICTCVVWRYNKYVHTHTYACVYIIYLYYMMYIYNAYNCMQDHMFYVIIGNLYIMQSIMYIKFEDFSNS